MVTTAMAGLTAILLKFRAGREHDLPCDDQGHVQFPDVRIEYDIEGREHTLDVEVMAPHYRGAHCMPLLGRRSLTVVDIQGESIQPRVFPSQRGTLLLYCR